MAVALFATSYYVVQRTSQVRLFSCPSWRLSLSGAGSWSYWRPPSACRWATPAAKEYAELEWPIDILITLVWVAYAVVFLRHHRHPQGPPHLRGQLVLRAFILAVASCTWSTVQQCRRGLMKSLLGYAGVQDAMVQWWYGHNAVGFFLTAGFLG